MTSSCCIRVCLNLFQDKTKGIKFLMWHWSFDGFPKNVTSFRTCISTNVFGRDSLSSSTQCTWWVSFYYGLWTCLPGLLTILAEHFLKIMYDTCVSISRARGHIIFSTLWCKSVPQIRVQGVSKYNIMKSTHYARTVTA